MYIANCPFNKIKILSEATTGLEKSFWMMYSNLCLNSRETVTLTATVDFTTRHYSHKCNRYCMVTAKYSFGRAPSSTNWTPFTAKSESLLELLEKSTVNVARPQQDFTARYHINGMMAKFGKMTAKIIWFNITVFMNTLLRKKLF